jgi:copper transport protein
MVAIISFTLTRLQKSFLLFCMVTFFLLLTPLNADAHAQYQRSTPAANERLERGRPPAFVQVWFTEQVEPSFSKLQIFDKNRQRVDQNDSQVAPGNPYSLIISLRPKLPDGAYTVVFQNVSQEDGHATKGNFSFVVGAGPLPTNTSALLSQYDENINAWSVILRWLNYVAMAAR